MRAVSCTSKSAPNRGLPCSCVSSGDSSSMAPSTSSASCSSSALRSFQDRADHAGNAALRGGDRHVRPAPADARGQRASTVPVAGLMTSMVDAPSTRRPSISSLNSRIALLPVTDGGSSNGCGPAELAGPWPIAVIQGSGSPAGSKRSMCLTSALEQRFGFEQRQRPADAGVDAVAPAQLAAQVAPDVELVRCRPFARIAVGRREHQTAPLSLRNDVAVDLDVARRDATRHA